MRAMPDAADKDRPRSPAVPLDSAENATIHITCFSYSPIVVLSVYFGVMLIVALYNAGTCCCRDFPCRAANSIYREFFLYDCLETVEWQLLQFKEEIMDEIQFISLILF